MSKITHFFMLLAVFLLLINFAYAASFDVKIAPIKDQISVDDVAEFNVTIQNNLDTGEDFIIKKAGYPFWDMYTKPLQNPISITVPALGSASINLFVHPLYITSVDTYTLSTGVILERTGQEQKVPVTIGIKSTSVLINGYVPTVLATTSVTPEKIDPRENAVIRIALSNQNVINYTNLTIKLESKLFKDEVYTPLGPKEDKTIELTKKLNPMTVPQHDNIVIAIFKDERLIVNPTVKEIEIAEYYVQEEIPKEESFLKIKKGVEVFSNNPDHKGTIKIETTPLKNLFTTTQPRAEIVKENKKYYLLWDVQLDQNRTFKVYTIENYRPIIVIITMVIAVLSLYFLFRSPIVVRKSIANVGLSEGGVSGAKVVVRVKNRSSKQIANIEVMDYIPHIAHIEKDLSIGSMQPHAFLTHPKKGVVIKWAIESLEAGDERVLSYRMRSRLSILGEFNLPAASARCHVGQRVIISNSNRVTLGN